MGNAVIR